MKISKLFHWLYAILMLLPAFAILSTILVNTFNKEVTQPTQEAEITYKYETNDVNSASDLIVGNVYHLTFNEFFANDYFLSENVYLSAIWLNGDIDTFYINDLYMDDAANPLYTGYVITFSTYAVEIVGFRDSNYIYDVENLTGEIDVQLTFINYTNDMSLDTSFITSSTYNEIESVEITTNDTSVNDIFYYAVDQVENSPMFSWAYDSFLVAPFQYIMNLFGVPSNHVIVELLSYWLAVSIIWLIFDVVMYVPLLAHRWLDKGVID